MLRGRPFALTTNKMVSQIPALVAARSLTRPLATEFVAKKFAGTCAADPSNNRLVTLKRFGPLAVITFDAKYKDEAANPMTPLMGGQIQEVVTELSKPGQGLGCVVMTGVRKSFLAGGHYKDFFHPRMQVAAPKTIASRQENTDFMFEFFNNFLSPRLKLSVPVIAAVNGSCIGAGLGVALGADIRVGCADHAKFSANFVKLGVQPGTGVSYNLPLFVGHTHATRMMLTGEVVDAGRAENIGLISESVPFDYRSGTLEKFLESIGQRDYYEDAPGVLVKALEMALHISRCEPGAVRSTTRSIRDLHDGRFLEGLGVKRYPNVRHEATSESLLRRQLMREAVEQSLSWQNDGFRAWVGAIKEKRTPQYELMNLYEKTPYEVGLFDAGSNRNNSPSGPPHQSIAGKRWRDLGARMYHSTPTNHANDREEMWDQLADEYMAQALEN